MAFLKAVEARNTAVNQTAVFNEIQLIEKAIMTAASSGKLSIIVGPNSDPPVTTGMTVNTICYNAYNDPTNYKSDEHNLARNQMDKVINNFHLLGYTVRREKIVSTTTFNWNISW